MKKLLLLIAFFSIAIAVSQSQVITTYAGTGSFGYSGDGGPATNAELYDPGYLVFDKSGNLYISDIINDCIRKVNCSGIISTIAGGPSTMSGDGVPASSASLHGPGEISIDAHGNLYIGEFDSYVVRKIDTLGIISTVAGNGTYGYSGHGGPATAASISSPNFYADRYGNVFIADYDNKCVRRVDAVTGIITNFAGTGIAGFSGDGGPATNARIGRPEGVGVDTMGNIYIFDGDNHRIRKVNPLNIISTIAGNGINDNSGDGGPATAASIMYPNALVVDRRGNLYFNSGLNIRKINTAGIISNYAGNGSSWSSGDNGPATAAGIQSPLGVAVNEQGDLFIADIYGQRVRKVSRNTTSTTVPTLEKLSLFPNPANDELTITCVSFKGATSFLITDIVGNLVKEEQRDASNSTISLNISQLTPGRYILIVATQDGQMTREFTKL